MKKRLIEEFNALGIDDLGEVTELYEGKGSFVNLEYLLPNGLTIKLWQDDKTYLINQIEKETGNRCYGLVADETYLLVCEYGDQGIDPKIIVFKHWK